MKKSSLLASGIVAALSCLVAQCDAISLATFLLLHQQAVANHRRQQELLNTRQSGTTWAAWSQWSTCTSTVRTGVRVRSRACDGDAATCDTLPGDNYEVESCTHKATEAHKRDAAFVQQCTDDADMRNTMSCRLYMENMTLAYDIYATMGCIMSVLDDSNYEGEDESRFVFGRYPETRSGETSAVFDAVMVTEPMTSGRMTANQRTPRQGDGAQANGGGGPISGPLASLATNQLCVETCRNLVTQATGIRTLLLSPPNTVDGILALLQAKAIVGNAARISSEHTQCIAECQLFGASYAYARLSLASQGLDSSQQNDGLRVSPTSAPRAPVTPVAGKRRKRSLAMRPLLVSRERLRRLRASLANAMNMGAGPTHRPRTTQPTIFRKPTAAMRLWPTSAWTENATATKRITAPTKGPKRAHMPARAVLHGGDTHGRNVSAILRRARRQAPISPSSYTNPCQEEEDVRRNPRVVNMDDTPGELFFFERRRQRFLRRRCTGTAVVSGSLYLPRETVTQDRTKQRAICKQAYLARFGLMIFYDEQGEYAFQDGQRFSVKLRQFKLESNCELSVPV